MTQRDRAPVILGEVAGVFGVKGWLRVRSYTDPVANILDYATWLIDQGAAQQAMTLREGRPHGKGGKGLIARLEGVDDRDAAAALVGRSIAVTRDQLPPVAEDEYYWADLEGLAVETVDGQPLGRVGHLIGTGANDVLVVEGERERLIPFLRPQVIREVDLAAGRIRVEWDPEF